MAYIVSDNIVFEDNHILVVVKPQNLPCCEDESKDKDLLNILKEYIKVRDKKPGNVFLGLVHRLDRPTGGVMVFAKTSKAAERLSKSIQNGEMGKRYMAIVHGSPREKQGTLIHYLKKDESRNTVHIVPLSEEGAKRAELNYKTLETDIENNYSLIDVDLKTGRSHQIRVQLNSLKTPIYGDFRYGGDKVSGDENNLALWAYELHLVHPVSKQAMVFISYPPYDNKPWNYFNIEKYELKIHEIND